MSLVVRTLYLVLFFMDESEQKVGGLPSGALGAVVIPSGQYNRFCGGMFSMKRELFGATELYEHEIKANSYLAKSVFRWTGDQNKLLEAVDRSIDLLAEHDGRVFALWTDRPDLLTLRKGHLTNLTTPYKDMLVRFAHYMKSLGLEERGGLFFDQLDSRADLRCATAVQNYMVRTNSRFAFQKYFIQVPHYTHSAVAPGLQIADLVAYLAGQQIDPSVRPELTPIWEKFQALAVSGRQYGTSSSTIGRMADRVPTVWPTKRRRGGGRESGRETQGLERR